MTFSNPLGLLLLLFLPLLALIGWPARGENRGREIFSLVIRLVLVTCLVLAVAGLEAPDLGSPNRLAVVFLIDVSDSMSNNAKAQAVAYTRQALESMGPDDQAAVVVFAKEALIERPMSPSKELAAIASVPDPGGSDLAEAIQLGMALYPPGAARRMVILSDGAANGRLDADSASQTAARLAAAAGVDVVVSPIMTQTGAEVIVRTFNIPTTLNMGDLFNPEIVLEASQPTKVNLRIFAGDEVVYEEANRELQTGETRIGSITLQATGSGFSEYRLQISTPNGDNGASTDGFYQNNTLAAFSTISGAPRVLIVSPPAGEILPGGEARPDEFSILQAVLGSQPAGSSTTAYQVSYRRPVDMPLTWEELASYNAVVLVDVPARQLNQTQMNALQRYVSDLGGGLVVVGGPTSFGVGGYFRTTLEDMLPVEMQIKDEERRPTLSIVYIVDHSGSMADSAGGVTKLDLAKEAVVRSLDLLMPGDRVGVIAFDDQAMWVVEMTDLSDPMRVRNAIGSIREGGGTDILAGVQAMARVLPEESSQTRHAILLTDGGADPSGIPELVESLFQEQGITLSTIGVGQGAANFLDDLAALGGGRYHFAANPSQIPQIYAEETSIATRAYIVEETFFPSLVRSSSILDDISAVPALYGYVATSPRSNANLILQSDKEDPILAEWNYGLGKVVAFTSDATGRWGKEWVMWDQFTRFWLNVVSFVESQPVTTKANFSIQHIGETAVLQIDARDEQSGGYMNGENLSANILSPDGEKQIVALRQTAPGRYTGEFAPTGEGSYQINVSAGSGANAQRITSFGWVYGYSAEYARLNPDPDALLRVAAAANGRIAGPDAGTVFAHTLTAPGTRQPLWPLLLAAAMFLLPFDIAIRRLVITKRDLVALGQWLGKSLQRSTVPVAPARSERMEKLLNAREKALDERRRPGIQLAPDKKREDPEKKQAPLIMPSQAPQAKVSSDKTTSLEKHPEQSSEREDSVSKLLKSKRSKNQN